MARALTDVTGLTAADARAQWQAVLARKPPQAGSRQSRFLPVEDALCFALFRILEPARYGSNNIARAPGELHALAALLRRPPSSLLDKMRNLQGVRLNGQAADVDVYLALMADPGLAARVHEIVLDGARAFGGEAGSVPNLMALGVGQTEDLGQDEIGSAELASALGEQLRAVAKQPDVWKYDGRATERLVELRVRQGQRLFARAVLENFGHRCGFCGLGSLQGSPIEILRASHIKPWCESSPSERLDETNGIAACPNHDAAFDMGLLYVNGGYKIHARPLLRTWLERDPRAAAAFGESATLPGLFLPPSARPPDPRFLAHHRKRWDERLRAS